MMDEAQILIGLRNRDMAAFEMLYDSLSSFVMYYVQKITKDQQEAEDVTVHSFSKFWEQDLSEYDSMKKVKNFILKVAKNSALMYLRRRRVMKAHEGNIIYLTREQEEFDMERSRYQMEMLLKVYQEIDNLPRRTQQAFKLVYIHEMTSREAGQQLNISEVTVRRLCSEALQKLRNKFSEKDLQLILFLLALCEFDRAALLASACSN